MNVQVERLENHTARLTVEVEAAQVEKAKENAARKLAQRYTIPGFRKGKAPYRIIVNYVGEAAILEEAVEGLGNELYKQALDESDIRPYGPGSLEDVKVEPAPVFSFIVPLQPTVDLGDYRSLRMEFKYEEIEDSAVERAMKLLQEQQALVEPGYYPAALNNRVTIDVHGYVLNEESGDEESHEDDETKADEHNHEDEAHDHEQEETHEQEEGDHEHHHEHGEDGESSWIDEVADHEHQTVIAHHHDAVVELEEGEDEPFGPGFSQALVGAIVGESREFEITYPDDEKTDENLRGKNAKFYVTVKKIEVVTLPAQNDDFAARLTKDEEKPLTLLELRVRVRENLIKTAEQQAKSNFARDAVEELVKRAKIAYPEAMVADQVQELVNNFDRELRERAGMRLDDYKTIYKKSDEDLYKEFRESAVRTLERSLVMSEVLQAEKLDVPDDRINEEIGRIAGQFGDGGDQVRKMFEKQSMRDSLKSDLLRDQVLDRIVAIAKGEVTETAEASEMPAAPSTEPQESPDVTEEKGESVQE